MSAKILVVDDEPDVLRLIAATLEHNGYDVVTADSGPKALRVLENSLFDLVILDVMMPGMSGFEVCRKIKSNPKHQSVPVVFLTAKWGGEALREGLEAGALMYIQKPFTTRKLLRVVESALGIEDF